MQCGSARETLNDSFFWPYVIVHSCFYYLTTNHIEFFLIFIVNIKF